MILAIAALVKLASIIKGNGWSTQDAIDTAEQLVKEVETRHGKVTE